MSIAIVTREPVDVSSYISGQEYYLHTLAKVLPRFNIKVEFLTISQLLRHTVSYDRYDSYHLYYLSLRDVIRLREIVKNSKLVYHVYHVEDVTWSKTHELSWKTFLVSLQFLVDMYLATARSVYLWLRHRAPLAQCLLIEPYYECQCDSFHEYAKIITEKFSGAEREIRLLYIGRFSQYRSPPSALLTIARGVAKRLRKHVKLTIVSKVTSRKKLYKYGNDIVTLYFIDERIGDDERCKLYRESHFFIYLSRGNVAMNPPITLLESVYHGTIPIVSSQVLSDLEVPLELVADSVNEAIKRIIALWSNLERLDEVIRYLKKFFKRFYDVHRFVEAIKRTL